MNLIYQFQCTIVNSVMAIMTCTTVPSIDEISPIIREFSEKTEISQTDIEKHLNFEFADLDWDKTGKTIGQCSFPFNGAKGTIKLDLNYWNQASQTEKESVLIHELGHCACTLQHPVEIENLETNWFISFLETIGVKTNRIERYYFKHDRTCPTDLMFPYAADGFCMIKYKEEYYKTIKNKCIPFGMYTFPPNVVIKRRKN